MFVSSSSKVIKAIFIALNTNISMGESFQDYTWIQDFEADFP